MAKLIFFLALLGGMTGAFGADETARSPANAA